MRPKPSRTALFLLVLVGFGGSTAVLAAAAAPAVAAAAPAALGDDDGPKISVDGQTVETIVPAAVKGRNLLIPGDLVVKLGVGIKWDKKKITMAHGDTVAVIPVDGGKKGGELHKLDRKTEVPLVPARVLREAFNLNFSEWKRGEEAIVVNTKEPFNPYKKEPEPPGQGRDRRGRRGSPRS